MTSERLTIDEQERLTTTWTLTSKAAMAEKAHLIHKLVNGRFNTEVYADLAELRPQLRGAVRWEWLWMWRCRLLCPEPTPLLDADRSLMDAL